MIETMVKIGPLISSCCSLALILGSALQGVQGGSHSPRWTPGESRFQKEERQLRDLLLLEPDEGVNKGTVLESNPCLKMRCGVGEECYVSEDSGEAYCDCIKDCGQQSDPRRKVCSNHNETFFNDCEIHRLRCFCEQGNLDKCQDPDKYKHVHVEYYGECRKIPECSSAEMEDFPRRMREWLFNIMKELAEREELSYHYQEMEREAEDDYSRRWTNAVIWKWCDLDGDPKDGSISRHELFPIKAPLQALEHCIGMFLDTCDRDDDHNITLEEWGACLEIPKGELQERCEGIEQGF